MIYKLGIVGHPERIKIIVKTIKKNFNNIEFFIVECSNRSDITSALIGLDKLNNFVDGVLFTGDIIYKIIYKLTTPKVPWNYLKPNHSQLLRCLLQAKMDNYDILNISLDSYDYDTAIKVYNSINIHEKDLKINHLKSDIYSKDIINNLIKSHKNNYNNNNVSFCITNVSAVYKKLKTKDIPCYMLSPLQDIISQEIQELLLKHKANKNKENQLVIVKIKIDKTNEYSFINENEYHFSVEKSKVINEIYLFAQKIQGTFIEINEKEYLLICTKSIFEKETKDLTILNFLYKIQKNTEFTVSAGIGYGLTGIEARKNSTLGVNNAQNQGGNRAFVVYNSKSIIGPIMPEKPKIDSNEKIFNNNLKTIAEKTNLSVNTIFKIQCAIEQKGENTFTSKELSDIFGVTPRSINKIIEKLQIYNYAEIVGKRVTSTAGRPSRIIKILI